MLVFLDNNSPAMMELLVKNNLLQKNYMQCFKCHFVEDNFNMMDIKNYPCPNCGGTGVKTLFPNKPQLQSVYADIIQSFYEYDQKYHGNKNSVIEWIQNEIKVDEELANELFEQSSKLDMYQFADTFMETLKMEKIEVMNFFHAIYREKSIPKIQMSHIAVHSMTLLEMYLSYLIQSILMRSQTNIEIVKHTLDSCKNWNQYFRTIKKLSEISWKNDISPKLFDGLSTTFDDLKKVRNNLVHRSQFVDDYRVVKDAVTMASRLLPVFADLHNEFLLGDIEGGWMKVYI